MAVLDVVLVPALGDNYIYLLREPASDTVAVVDPGDADPVLAELDRRGWALDLIINTHHHGDHVAGNAALKQRFGAPVVGPRADADRIGGLDRGVGEGDTIRVGDQTGTVIETPGHTSGHIAVHFAESRALFCGDTLFAMGCGRLFEGTPAQMWASLLKLRALPGETRIYCGHEYTQKNAQFALTMEPDNAMLKNRAERVDRLRAEGAPTIPSLLAEELETNPFLRADRPELRHAVGLGEGADAIAVFAEVRAGRNRF